MEQEVQVPKKCTCIWAKRPHVIYSFGFPQIVCRNPKLYIIWGRFAQMNLVCTCRWGCSCTFVPHTSVHGWIWCARAGEVAAALLFHTHQSVETRILGTETSEKTNFRSWRKDKGQIVNFKFNLYILFMFIFNSFLNCNVFVIAVSEFCLLFLTKIDFKTGFQAFSFSNENLTLYRWIIKRLVCRTDLC